MEYGKVLMGLGRLEGRGYGLWCTYMPTLTKLMIRGRASTPGGNSGRRRQHVCAAERGSTALFQNTLLSLVVCTENVHMADDVVEVRRRTPTLSRIS